VACLNDRGQWIILMGFVVSASIFFLALVANQAVLVGQTTAEGVSDFAKDEIRDLRSEAAWIAGTHPDDDALIADLQTLSLHRDGALVTVSIGEGVLRSGATFRPVSIHYTDGITEYSEVFHHAVP